MVSCKREKDLVNKNNVLEVVDDAFSIEKVHCRSQPVPIQRLGEAQSACTAGNVGNRNNLLKGDNLYSRNDSDDVEMPHEHGPKESPDHDKSPYRSSDKSLLLLLIFGDWLLLKLYKNKSQYKTMVIFEDSQTSNAISVPSLGFAGGPGSDAPSLISEKLLLRPPSMLVLWPLR